MSRTEPTRSSDEKANLATDRLERGQVERVRHGGVVGDDSLLLAEHLLHRRGHDLRITPPPATASRPATSDRHREPAASRSAGASRRFRLDIASPSGSRTVGQPTISAGRSRSSTS